MSAALEAARDGLEGATAWLVGGALRDRLLGRPVQDVDVVVEGELGAAARAVARAGAGVAFLLSDRFGAWRVVGPGHDWQVDLSAPVDGTILADLARRDFTVNAMAEPLAGGELLDPFGGREDLAARRLRMVGPGAFDDDPLRVLRLVRLSCELGLDIDPATRDAAARRSHRLPAVAGERSFAELKRLLVGERPLGGVRELQAVGAIAALLPELEAMRGVTQGVYHHLDVYEHTLAVLDRVVELERDPEPLGPHAGAVAAVLAEPLAEGLNRGQALRLAALLHDVAKPATRSVGAGGRVGFPDHDRLGAAMAREVLGRLRAGERLRSHVAALTRNHLRLGFLVHRRPLSRRTVYRYLRACDGVEVDVTVLSVADRLATRGRKAQESIARHLELAADLLGESLRWRREGPPGRLVRGDELAAELGLAPGPQLGRLLAELEEARFAGEVSTRQEALDHARALLARGTAATTEPV